MAKLDPQQNRYYPSPTKTGPLHDDFRTLFNHVYALQDELKSTKGQLADMTSKHQELSQKVANGPSTTKIQGIPVKAVPPTNGQALKYNAATGEVEWT